VTRRRIGALLVVALAAAGSVRCVGDLFHPTVPRVDYAFLAPFADTVLDVGDTSLALPCRLSADGRPIDCALGLSWSGTGSILQVRGGRLAVIGYGTATVKMRPLNTELPVDTIERTAHVHAVVPTVTWVDGREVDTLAVGAMRLVLALATTRSGALIGGAPLNWVQDSGQGVAHMVSGLQGWMRADSVGVAVFRVVSDTGATPPRRVVVVPQITPVTSGAHGPLPGVRRSVP
jgi:hypothetical protein